MKDLLAQLAQGRSLSTDQAIDAFEKIMTGQVTPAQLGAALARARGELKSLGTLAGAWLYKE